MKVYFGQKILAIKLIVFFIRSTNWLLTLKFVPKNSKVPQIEYIYFMLAFTKWALSLDGQEF